MEISELTGRKKLKFETTKIQITVEDSTGSGSTNASDLYSDAKLTIPWNFATDKISGCRARVYVKTSGGLTVTFDSQGGTAVDSVGVTPNAGGY